MSETFGMRFGKQLYDGKALTAARKAIRERTRVPHVMLHGVEHKSCARCCHLKPLDEFYVSNRRKDHFDSYCQVCRAEVSAASEQRRRAKQRGA